ncbi:nucleoside hydrolase [Pleomorphochaeta sp. DL1XJH-081]|uniref:nucleoside hydrolase n=1 Tax=Pleomorphochaeta sp. DL1XJH-081 TaxID=3409690 RepID=UPI003BB6E3B2
MAKKIILDVDTGHDDMVAIVMASGLQEIELMGLVAVSGNQILEKALLNTLHVCDLIGEPAPVFAGMDRPLLRDQFLGGDIHGKTGLDGPVFPPLSKQAEKRHGVQFIIDTVLANPHEITLVPTGPLTDIAMAIRLEPRLPNLVESIVCMGGSMGKGNRTPYAEFNMFADPEAAEIVFSSGAPLVMMGLDVTLKVRLDATQEKRFASMNTKTAAMFNASMDNYRSAYRLHGSEYPAMHDPCCVAFVADPSIFTLEKHDIHVELHDSQTYGKTHAGPKTENGRVSVGVDADTDRFWNLLDRALHYLP